MKNPIILKVDSKEKYFLQFLTIINPMVLNLDNKTLQVLAVLLTHYDNLDASISYELKNKILFSPSYRRTLRDAIKDEEGNGMTEGAFNNYLQKLKQKKLLTGRYSEILIIKWLIVSPSVNKSLTFNWEIKE